MLKIVTPLEIILNEAENNEIVKSFAEMVNGLLKDEKENYSYSYKVKMEAPLTAREKYLIEKVFLTSNWIITLNLSSEKEENVVIYNIFLTPKG